MKKVRLALIATLLAVGAWSPAQASTSITKLVVSATGANEAPNIGAKTGSASGTFILNTYKNTLCFANMKTRGLVDVIGAHIHLGAWGFEGSIFASFDISNFNRAKNTCVKLAHRTIVDIAKHPADYYFNVHTKVFPNGAVRGQLKKIP